MNEQRAKRERGTGTIFQRGSTWWIQYYVRGQKVRESADTDDEKKALKLLRRKLGEVDAGIHKETRRITYEELREAYYQDYAVNQRKSLRRDKNGDPHLDKVVRLDGFFSGYRASEIDADLIRKFIADQQAKGLANGSINRSVSALRRMFHLAKEDGKIRDIPHFPMVKEAKPRQGFFEREQYDALSQALPDYLRLPLAIGYFTGMRLGEILSLQWKRKGDDGQEVDQVDFLAGLIHLQAGETKNDDPRDIPIVPELRKLLLEERAKRQLDCPYICFRLDRGHAVQVRGFRKAWYSACVRAGLGEMVPAVDSVTGKPLYEHPRGPRSKPKPKMTFEGRIFHDLRRSGVRNLVNAGVPEKVAMKISGHRTRSTFDRYHIVPKNDIIEAGRKLAAFHENGHNSGTIATSLEPSVSLPN